MATWRRPRTSRPRTLNRRAWTLAVHAQPLAFRAAELQGKVEPFFLPFQSRAAEGGCLRERVAQDHERVRLTRLEAVCKALNLRKSQVLPVETVASPRVTLRLNE